MKYQSVAVLFLMCVGLFGTAAYAIDCVDDNGVVFERDGNCYTPKGGGGEVPVPFGLKTTAELADGETYILMGRVVVNNHRGNNPTHSRVYFEVDLKQQPWLANAKRRAMPMYPLDGPVNVWKQWDGQTIRLNCRAHGKIVQVNYELQYVISLEGYQPD